MGAEDEYIKSEVEKDQDIDYEELRKHTAELNRAALFKEIIKPDYHENIKYDVGQKKDISPFTKELKTSFLREFDIRLVEEISDIINILVSVGARGSALMLLAFRDIKLSVAPSRDATLLRLMNTEYSFKKIGVDKKERSFLKRGGESEWQN